MAHNTSSDTESHLLSSQITFLEHEKTRLLLELDKVNQKLTTTRADYHTLHNRQLPISKLPLELLASIFLLIQESSRIPGGTIVAFEVVASHVCRHWRAISLGTPLLWSKIDISIITQRDVELKNLEGFKTKLSIYLTRSSTCPVVIFLKLPCSVLLDDYLPILLPHANRWYRLSIDLWAGDLQEDEVLIHLGSAYTPLLQHLSITCNRWQRNRGEPPPVKFSTVTPTILTSGAPALTFARLAGKVLGVVQPPLHTVQTLHLEGGFKQYMSYDQFITLFTSLPSLVNLSLTDFIVRLPQDPFITPKPISLPSLRCLRLCGTNTPAHRLLTLLSLPNIDNLVLREIDSFESLVLMNPVIRTLTLRECAFSEEEVREVVKAFPMAVNVAFDDSIPQLLDLLGTGTETDDDLGLDTEDSQQQQHLGPYPWPHLGTLTLLDMRTRDVIPLCRMVERMKMSGRIVPIVRLTRRARSVLKLKDRLEWLKGMTKVESWDCFVDGVNGGGGAGTGGGEGEGGRWPPGLGYIDEEDF
ncbi:hypothetical protein BDN72DRAFT_832423 [Pluteus cervinus]|uniref:Uncharacterized protein n=1 Tax=Pluteus cervinus TaxID=181527 RepID=A0ACD3B9W8_9AGAR|nr:hypothetical protein BDN72DRAFT_832423 [Pluteus cervinus]